MTTNTNIHMTNRNQNKSRSTLSRLLWVSPLAMAIAGAVNLTLYFAAGNLVPEVTAWAGAGVGQIVGATIVYLIIGAVVLALINRVSSQPARHYTIVATIGLVLSLWLPISAGLGFGPPGTAAAGLATVVTLSLMHVVSYVVSLPLYVRLAIG